MTRLLEVFCSFRDVKPTTRLGCVLGLPPDTKHLIEADVTESIPPRTRTVPNILSPDAKPSVRRKVFGINTSLISVPENAIASSHNEP